MGNVVNITVNDGVDIKYEYDLPGNLISETDSLGNKMLRLYNDTF